MRLFRNKKKEGEARIDLIKEMQVLELRPGDVIVLKMKGLVSEKVWPRITENFKKIVGKDNKVMLLEDGMEIGILRPSVNAFSDCNKASNKPE